MTIEKLNKGQVLKDAISICDQGLEYLKIGDLRGALTTFLMASKDESELDDFKNALTKAFEDKLRKAKQDLESL